MNRNQHATVQKWLLIFTGIVMFAFLFTFPTRDRRGIVDRIRLKVGADHLVSKKTLKEMAEQEAKNSRGRKPVAVADTRKLDQKALARGQNSPAQQQARMQYNVSLYCNKSFDATACSQWLNTCGESCRLLVRQDLWSKFTARRPVVPAPSRTVATKNKGR